jgi:hypothetical protein
LAVLGGRATPFDHLFRRSTQKWGQLYMYERYEDVPYFRRSGPVGTITFLGLFFGPAILVAGIIALTGDVYTNKKDQSGKLITWSFWNKIAAVIILIIQIVFTYAILTGKLFQSVR